MLPRPEDIARQLAQHVESLRAAGVQWVPAADRWRPPPPGLFDRHVEEELAPPPREPDRRVALTLLVDEVKACTACGELAATRTQTVFGVGPMDPEICFVGEAPGADEDRQGEPFVGAAGKVLDRLINRCGLKREEVFICNILRCRPPGNRNPKVEEAANCRPFLERTLAIVRPKFIVCLGAVAANNLLQLESPIGKMRGRFYDYLGVPVVCTYHPSYLLRSDNKKPYFQVWDDMKMLLTRMGRPIPDDKKSGG